LSGPFGGLPPPVGVVEPPVGGVEPPEGLTTTPIGLVGATLMLFGVQRPPTFVALGPQFGCTTMIGPQLPFVPRIKPPVHGGGSRSHLPSARRPSEHVLAIPIGKH